MYKRNHRFQTDRLLEHLSFLNVICPLVLLLYVSLNNCPRRDFAQGAKSRGGTLGTSGYIKESTYS